MSLKIIGAGFGRTGTMSLKNALEQLGFDACYHMLEVRSHPDHVELWRDAWRGKADWDRLFEGFQAAVDWPAAAFWPELMSAYPEAKIILTVREPESWYRSAWDTIFQRMSSDFEPEDATAREQLTMAREIIRDGTFGGDLGDRENALRVFQDNTRRCIAEVPADRLIVYDPSEGWEGLCTPLGIPVPETPYPHLNTTAEFQARVAARKAAEGAAGEPT